MPNKEIKKLLEKQQYRVVGKHSAVKICGWTKNMLRGKGSCYKQKFYGIESYKCMQMTTNLACANRCIFCWRDYKEPVSKEWKYLIDSPELILNESLKQQRKLLSGFGGFDKVDKNLYNDSRKVRHAALSLTGEPIVYPKINEIIELMHKNKISTFLVTNGQYPEEIEKLRQVTQLYLSVDSPNKKLLKQIDVPLFKDYWNRFEKSLVAFSKKKFRKSIRLTIIKGLNDIEPENYAKLINKGKPDFVEVKAYMHVGSSIHRLKREAMPTHKEIGDFSKKLLNYLPSYAFVSEHKPSRVVLIAKKTFLKSGKWRTFIDFDKFFSIVNNGKEARTKEYMKEAKDL